MNEEGSQLLDSLMQMLGDNPSEAVGQMLAALTQSGDEKAAEGTKAVSPATEEASKTDEPLTAEPKGNASGGLDPAMLLKMQSLMTQLNSGETDERSALLTAIRPFLSEEHRPQIDRAIKLLKLTRLAQTAQEMNLFNGLL